MEKPNYIKDKSGELWWCNTHGRRAGYILNGRHMCNPDLGGITMVCMAVNLTNIAEIVEEPLDLKPLSKYQKAALAIVLQNDTITGKEIRRRMAVVGMKLSAVPFYHMMAKLEHLNFIRGFDVAEIIGDQEIQTRTYEAA